MLLSTRNVIQGMRSNSADRTFTLCFTINEANMTPKTVIPQGGLTLPQLNRIWTLFPQTSPMSSYSLTRTIIYHHD